MTRFNGMGQANGFEPPASSMLAIHIKPGASVPHLDQPKFAQLLEESLGKDESGRPNLGDDPVLNQKLIMVVVQVGIDPLLVSDQGDPFRSIHSSGRSSPQLPQCLAVLHLAVTRTRRILYQDMSLDDGSLSELPLYASLVPKLLSVAARDQDQNITKHVFDVFEAGLQNERSIPGVAVSTFRDFLDICFAGLLDTATDHANSLLKDEIVLEEHRFITSRSSCSEVYAGLNDRFNIATLDQVLYLSCQLATFLSHHESQKSKLLRLRKQSAKLQIVIDSLHETEHNGKVESLRAEVGGLSLIPQINAESFSTVSELDEWPDSDRVHKRPRLSIDQHVLPNKLPIIEQIESDLTLSLTGGPHSELIGLGPSVMQIFKTLDEDGQLVCLEKLGKAPCQIYANNADSQLCCSVCDDGSPGRHMPPAVDVHIDEIMQTLLSLKSSIQRRPQTRLLALQALRRSICHTNSLDSLRLKTSAAGEWCLQAMRSPSRELKIVASRLLQAFVSGGGGRDVTLLHDNRVAALGFLQVLWQSGLTFNHEVVILTLAQMARVVSESDLNIILTRLVDALGHSNAYISALAYAEIQQLAQHFQLAVTGLFRPYWRTLSVVIIQNLTKRPAIAQCVGDLIGTPVDGLLHVVDEFALPYLVLNRDQNTILRMCASSNSQLTPFELCTKQNVFPRTLALLLTQCFTDPEETIMSLLSHVSEDFKEQDLAGWLNLYLVEVVCELLKSIGDAGQERASKSCQALHVLAQMQPRRTKFSSSASSSRRSEHIAPLLERNALAIVTHFTNKLNSGAIEPNIEKHRYLGALGEVIKLGKGQVNVALPHICACLRAAMEDNVLCNTAFNVWYDVMLHVDEIEIRDLINQTFAIIVRYWNTLDSSMQDKAYNLIAGLLKEHEALIRDVYATLPSLSSIPVLVKFETDINKLKKQQDERNQIAAFVTRLKDETMIVAEQALCELSTTLRKKQDFVYKSILREQPDTLVADLTRALLDVCVKFNSSTDLFLLAGQCLGVVGCLDPSKIESIRDKRRFVVVNNFSGGEETIGFLMFFMEQVLVKEYASSSNLREKGFLAWSLQRLLQVCNLSYDITSRARVGVMNGKDKLWFELSDTTRLVLTPFLTSKFAAATKRPTAKIKYPYFATGMAYKTWLTEFTLDLLNRGSGDNVDIIFDVCSRLVVQGLGTSIASFLLPYAALNLLLAGTETDKQDLVSEMSWVLQQSLSGLDAESQEHVRQCSQSIFDMLDYMSLWLQENRKQSAPVKARLERGIKEPALDRLLARTQIVESVLASIRPQIITQKAVECRSYARALFHQEQYVTSQVEPSDTDYRRLQDIYAQIDEPDGIEGFSAQMQYLDVESEVMEHKKAGRWSAAQSWYEMKLIDQPSNVDVQTNLLRCLKESGQHEILIQHFDSITSRSKNVDSSLLPFAIEAAWVTNRWDKLSTYMDEASHGNFAVDLGKAMLALRQDDQEKVREHLDMLFQSCAAEFTPNSTVSFQASHESLIKMHVTEDVRTMLSTTVSNDDKVLPWLKKRLDILGSNVADKQYILGVQRAIMHLQPNAYKNEDIATSWMTSARLARKAQATQQAFNAVLRASVLGDKSAPIEQAKLMWQEGDHRKAIQTLQGAIDSGAFGTYIQRPDVDSMTVDNAAQDERNDMNAKAFVLLGKWLDQAGQTQSEVIIKTFRKSTEQNRRWEKGWYNLGRHYNKILESEKLKPPGKESQPFLTGEAAKLVIDNFLRALVSGNKYMFQTLPKVLTLWLELVDSDIEHDPRRGNTQFHQHNKTQRKKIIEDTNLTMKKYLERIQPYAFYTILPQLVARICHTDQDVNNLLQMMIIKVVKAFPQQALWTVLATVKSGSKDRATRGLGLLRKSAENAKKDLKVFTAPEMRDFITASQKFSDEVLRIADFHIEGRPSRVSLKREFGFNHKIAPSKLVVPSEACLIPNIPSNNDLQASKTFRAFAKDPITITAFLDDARVLPSLQRPRKLSITGSDGKVYSVLAKPHDDLRKDQRLMEFNMMINRFLKHDIDAAKRRLDIKTYAVIPLNEECGLIEWVDGLTTMRDILLKLYDQRGVKPDYAAVRETLDKICAHSEDKAKDYVEQVQSRFPPVLRLWFIENFPDPTAWFNARLRYTRTSAVMSMVGHVLGLGDRHGENILFEEGTGGILHVDFNCLFDKGLTFEKPERVPFRLTHNMRNGMGSYKQEGPFRRCCEITTTLLRNNEDALMTILETFLHDPTTDFQTVGKKRKTAGGYAAGIEVPDTPERMLEGVKGKVKGMLPGESVPLSVGGYVDYMIRQAKDDGNMVRMYIGWCAFL